MRDTWDTYDHWNTAIADVLFAPSEEVRPVYLDLEDDVLEELAANRGTEPNAAVDELCDAVASTLRRSDGPAQVFAQHDRRLRAWIRRGRKGAPPVLGVLATYSLAAEQMAGGDGMSAHNYFGRLRQVLRWQAGDPALDVAYRRVSERYWGELNRWLVKEEGARGMPTAFALAHRYVGLSVSQALVRSNDREKFKNFFQTFGFSPGSQVAPGDLVPLIDTWIKQPHCPVSASLARLWTSAPARSRIAEAAAVTLASWDGSVNDRNSERTTSSGRLQLTLELSGFPRRRFNIAALFFMPQAQVGRAVSVLTATPETSIDLVPDVPGALGLAPGASLHPDDVLGGVLRVQDDLSGLTLEHRPRRLVVFREDDLSRRWVEAQQVLLGDDLRLLVEDGLAARVTEVLNAAARPGWEVATYPGQPEGWTLFSGVEVLNHPGALISTDKMDDLAALIPLTSSNLKVSGGFPIPGSVRGKWHTAQPPEIRAVSEAPEGFSVRLVELSHVSEEESEVEVATWEDEGTGVVIESVAGLDLTDGDYRVDLVPAGQRDPASSTMFYLRSGDTRDERQWHLAESIAYGPGLGALGIPTGAGYFTVQGHEVSGAAAPNCPGTNGTVLLPSTPTWSRKAGTRQQVRQPIRIATPEGESCIRTGKHRQQIDTAPVDAKGKPTIAWVYGRCITCGLVKRYPTRGKKRKDVGQSAEVTTHRVHDLSAIAPSTIGAADRDWSIAMDTLLHLGGGAWGSLERVALQVEASGLFVDQFARTLEGLGHISIRRDATTLRPAAWEISPTQLTQCASGEFVFNGYWPSTLYNQFLDALEADSLDARADGAEPQQYFAPKPGDKALAFASEHEVPMLQDAWRHLVDALPPLSNVLEHLPRQRASADGEISWFDCDDVAWRKVSSFDAEGAFRIKKFATLDVVRSARDVTEGTFARCTVQLSKHLSALMLGRSLTAYDPDHEVFMVPVGAELPGLYGRALVAASGLPPVVVPGTGAIGYRQVPIELAHQIHDLLTR